MTVEEAVATRVAALAAVVALAGARIYVEKLPQAPVYPCVRVVLVDDIDSYHQRGINGLVEARVQVDAFAQEASGADPYAEVAALAQAIDGDGLGAAATGLSGWIGRVGSPALEMASVFRADRRRHYDPEELRVVTMSQDYIVTYRRPST